MGGWWMRGMAVSTEVLMLVIISIAAAAAVLVYLSSIVHLSFTESVTELSASYCGSVLVVKNIGDVSTHFYVYSGDGRWILAEKTLGPGEECRCSVGAYQSVVIVGENVAALKVVNNCYQGGQGAQPGPGANPPWTPPRRT